MKPFSYTAETSLSLGHAEANSRRKWCSLTAGEGAICLQIFYNRAEKQEKITRKIEISTLFLLLLDFSQLAISGK